MVCGIIGLHHVQAIFFCHNIKDCLMHGGYGDDFSLQKAIDPAKSNGR